MTSPVLLDCFCGAGGASMGYHQAGFEVVGVDHVPQKHYPFRHFQADALDFLRCLISGSSSLGFYLDDFAAIHASPPCQGYSIMRNLPWLREKEYPLLIQPVRELLEGTGLPYIIENVGGARYRASLPEGLKAGFLCGQMFGLPIFRHRYFETNWFWLQPGHPRHEGSVRNGRKLGGRARDIIVRKTGQKYGFDRPECAIGHANQGGISARDVLGVPWMTRDELSQAIPPAYTRFIGEALLRSMAVTT